ncbi:hypothetical protein PAA26_00790 [Methanomassiliicoccaceae archaeon COG_1]|nr:hypothetical protein [Methanomassiliicoccaceae archaeon COG_1]
MSRIIVAVCMHIQMGSNSMSRCSNRFKDPNVRKEMGLEEGLSQRTINRAVSLIGIAATRS